MRYLSFKCYDEKEKHKIVTLDMFRHCYKNMKLTISENFRIFYKIIEITESKEGITTIYSTKGQKSKKKQSKTEYCKRLIGC